MQNHIPDGEDTLKILVTTDNHVGYKENDPIRGDDSWKTFHEVTQIAKSTNVDMILHGGDLFHVNKPSKKSVYNVMKSLRLNCLGDRPCELELLSDPSLISGDGFNTVNYEDPNINVSIPVFAISGNHDDATGSSLLAPLDLLSVSGLINHFGKVLDNNEVTVTPILLQKGSTKLALYGMSSIKDERLFRIFRDGHVKFLRPTIDTDSWFNLLTVHQNHFAHTKTSYLPEAFLPTFLDFVVWGHEHECIPMPVYNPETSFFTLQAGSSVATSLCEGEAAQKNVFVLKINGKNFSLDPVPLKTIRPLIMEQISLQEEGFLAAPSSKDDISRFLVVKVEELIERAKEEYLRANPHLADDSISEDIRQQAIPLPLIRLRVDYTGNYEIEGPQRLSKKFVGRVANIDDLFQFHKKNAPLNKSIIPESNGKPVDAATNDASSAVSINTFLANFIKQADLTLLPEQGMSEAVKIFLDKDDKNALNEYIRKEIGRETKLLLNLDIDYTDLMDNEEDHKAAFKSILSKVKVENREKLLKSIEADDIQDASKARPIPKSARKPRPPIESDSGDEIVETRASKPAKGRTTRATGKRTKKPVSAAMVVDSDSGSDEFIAEDSNEDEDEVIESSEEDFIPETPKKKTAPKKAAARSTKSRATSKRADSKLPAGQSQTTGKRSLLNDILSMGS